MNITEILENNGIKIKNFGFKGSCYGRRETFPIVVSKYRTVRYGYLQNYYKGSRIVGNWVMVYEKFFRGSPECPSSYRCIYVKDKDYIKSIKLLSEYEEIKNFIVEVDTAKVKEEKERLKLIIESRLNLLSIEQLTSMVEIL
jgi:hypothetical protein